MANPYPADDPRAAAVLASPLQVELAARHERRAVLVHQTARSRLRVAAGMDHVVEVPDRADVSLEAAGDLARFTIAARLPLGSHLRLVKFLAYGWTSRRSAPALRDQVEGALATAVLSGWETLAAEQRMFLNDYWERADIEVDGDPELQQAVRFAPFHLLQAGVRGEQRAIPAKGLTGPPRP
jgi:alpha,alpha-trehalose phosphorylase